MQLDDVGAATASQQRAQWNKCIEFAQCLGQSDGKKENAITLDNTQAEAIIIDGHHREAFTQPALAHSICVRSLILNRVCLDTPYVPYE